MAAPEGHVAVVVDDYEVTLETLRAAGHEVEAGAALGVAARIRARTRRSPGGVHGAPAYT